jgi:hypothetical protein
LSESGQLTANEHEANETALARAQHSRAGELSVRVGIHGKLVFRKRWRLI